MSFESLLIHAVLVLNPATDVEDEDFVRYGNEEFTFDSGTSYAARVQQTGADEQIIDRDTRITTYRVFLPKDAVISALSRIEWDDRLFRVQGEPNVLDGAVGPHHIELVMQEVEG